METIDKEPTAQDIINNKIRLVKDALRDRHEVYPRFDKEKPYEVYDDTILHNVETPEFNGIVMHRVYYDSGINPEADTGPEESVVIAGIRDGRMVNYQSIPTNRREMVGPKADDIISAIDASLSAISPLQ
jgi:hypothetical protein